jgi:hypothetical protein
VQARCVGAPPFAMFDQEHPVDMVGSVHEFKFTSPHTFILLKVKGADGTG